MLSTYLTIVSNWNGFAASMIEAIEKYGTLTERQQASVDKMYIKHCEKQAAQAQVDSEKIVIDLAKIWELFNNAKGSGLKKPVLRIGDLHISIAPAHGRNNGCLYVKDNSQYAGKITPEGKFFGLRDARAEIEDELIVLATNPLEQATAYGRRTGSCACCGRTLTNKKSVELGIGPICRDKWGL